VLAADEVFSRGALAGLRVQIWGDWLALVSPSRLDFDPAQVRARLDEAP
jgi:hypothetical protein